VPRSPASAGRSVAGACPSRCPAAGRVSTARALPDATPRPARAPYAVRHAHASTATHARSARSKPRERCGGARGGAPRVAARGAPGSGARGAFMRAWTVQTARACRQPLLSPPPPPGPGRVLATDRRPRARMPAWAQAGRRGPRRRGRPTTTPLPAPARPAPATRRERG
jgi:hypothetical protein